jgi:sulfite exporter TauE/SafE
LIGIGFISGVSIPGLNRIFYWISGWIRKMFGLGLQKKTLINTFLVGMINGLVPCGISALAIMYCFILPDAQSGFLSMWVFGLGTWPVMFLFPMLLQRISGLFQINFKNVTVAAMAFSGILMIGHGIWGEHSVLAKEGKVIPTEMAICP